MADKIGIGGVFPQVTLHLVTGGTLVVPDQMTSKYRVVLFYRGHW